MRAHIWLATLVALVITVLALPVIIAWLRRGDHFDVPGARSSHRIAVPRGGGLAMLCGVAAGGVTFAVVSPNPEMPGRQWILLLLPLAMGLLGAAEDLRGLGIRTRLLGQFAIAFGGAASLLSYQPELSALLWAVPAAIVITAYVNAANFMDGVNGISGLHGLIAGGAFAVLGTRFSDISLQLGAMLLAAVSVGFLPWNAPRARVFLGDCGSYYIGGAASVLAVAAILAGAPVELAGAPLVIYIADTAWTMWSRYRRGESLHEAHRSHVYQRLTDFGFSHVECAGVVGAATAVVVALAWIATAGTVGIRVLCDALALLVVLAFLALPAMLRRSRVGQLAVLASR